MSVILSGVEVCHKNFVNIIGAVDGNLVKFPDDSWCDVSTREKSTDLITMKGVFNDENCFMLGD